MKVLCFGIAKDIIGESSIMIDGSGVSSVIELRQYLNTQFPKFAEYTPYRIAINQAFADEQDVLSAVDEIAIIPPVSGG